MKKIKRLVLVVFYFIGRMLGYIMPFNKVKATILVLKSKRKPDVDAIAFFGRTPQDFNDDIKKCAAETYKEGAEVMIINGIESKDLGLSNSEWSKELKSLGIDNLESYKESTNTASEARAMVALAKKRGWKTMTLLAHSHQILRCIRAVVKAMEEADYEMRVYCQSPVTDWFEETAGSQNANVMPRINHSELEYGIMVNILSFLRLVPAVATAKELINYMKRRESIPI